MKTSNKILIGLLAIIFTVPLLLALTLKSKMKKGEYVVKSYDNNKNKENYRSGSFTAFKVVKIIAPAPNVLFCNLKQADKMNYEYYIGENKESVTIYNDNDTLYIKYTETKINDKNEGNNPNLLSINVSLPAFSNLVVDGAVVVIEEASFDNLSVTLKNKGVVKSGGSKNDAPGGFSMKKDKPLEIDDKERFVLTEESNKKNIFDIEYISLKMPDINIKDFLIRQMFYRI